MAGKPPDSSPGFPLGGWLPKRNEQQRREYDAAKPKRKIELNKELGKQQRAECQEENRDNDATDFQSRGIFGWCLGHSPDEDEDN